MACFCLKSPSPNNLQPWCLTSRCTTGLLTLVFLPFDFSCASICHPPKGPNCGSRPHCHLPVWNQRKPSARCLLAEGGKSGKSKQSHTNQCVETIVSFLLQLSLSAGRLVLTLSALFEFTLLYAQLLSTSDSPALLVHTHTQSTSNYTICHQYLYYSHRYTFVLKSRQTTVCLAKC